MNKNKIDFNYLEERDAAFELVSNRIAYYYQKVFDIKIINIFYKRNLEKMNNKNIVLSNYLEAMRIDVFDFYILIKDNNKKIFKYKLLKAQYDGSKYREGNNKYISFLENLYFFVDEYICKYCRKNYLGKHNKNQIDDILKKNNEINEDYQKWILEHYE